ncbi:MAG: DUF2752 domain-containing protein [Phycisphaerae bacterium]|nr:DUF2752 domain-containing protein [Phycisphaerae bacterium]
MILRDQPDIFWVRLQLASISSVIGFAAVLLYYAKPGESGLFPPCPFNAITGLYCPGCGTLRGLHQLLHGNLMAAMGLNSLMVLSLPYLGYAYFSLWSKAIRNRPLPGRFIPAKWIWALLSVVIIFAIARNIPAYPFTILAP